MRSGLVAGTGPAQEVPPPFSPDDRREAERDFVGAFIRGGAGPILRNSGGVPALARTVAALTDPIARRVGSAVVALVSRGFAADITKETIVLATGLSVIDVLSLGAWPQEKATNAIVYGWFEEE